MLRSLFSGVSGLRAHQTKMDVIGNNISNVNTVGFKSSSVNFTDVFYQTSRNATGPNNDTQTAGRNPMQVGLGSNVSSITTSIAVSGASQRTDNPFDLMIEGDGFFIVNSGGSNYFTKAGAFDLDAFGNLAMPNGAMVMGWKPDNLGRIVISDVEPIRVRTPETIFSAPEATRAAYVNGNIDQLDSQIADPGRTINIPFYDNKGYAYTANLKIVQDPADKTKYSVSISDVKDADSQSIFVEKGDDGKYKAKAGISFKFGNDTITVADANVNPDTGEVNIPAANASITFDNDTGKFLATEPVTTDKDGILSFEIVAGTDSPFRPIDIDFSTITMYASSGATTLEAHRGNLAGFEAGKKAGSMIGQSIGADGKVFGHYDNGDQKLLGQIAIASFENPAGLEAVGNNMFAETQNSGTFDGIGKDITGNGGEFATGFLEMSNVDLSAEFTHMITTQRGFQANSRIITTSDTLLEELINLKR